MNKILCIGEALIDMICTDKGQPLKDGQHFLKKPGGAPTNVAAAIAALGGNAVLAAKVGADPFGQHLQEVMRSFGVHTQWMLQDAYHFTTFAFVSLMENGERDFYFNRGADGQLASEDLAGIDLNEYGIVHFGSATAFLPAPLQNAYHDLLDKALHHPHLLISFDPNYRQLLFGDKQDSFKEQSWHFMRKAHFFKVSDEEALLLTGATSVNEAAEIFKKETNAGFAITLGKDGTLVRMYDTLETVGSIAITPVDTTGAGDAFVGALLYQLSGHPLHEIKNFDAATWRQLFVNANKAGARTCEYLGAMEAFKHLNNSIFS
jgi:fructokinase